MIRRIVSVFAVVANLVLVDAMAKEYAAASLKDSAPYSVLDGFFNLAYVENRGCAWGMFQGSVLPLAAFALVALMFIAWKRKSIFPAGAGRLSRSAAFVAECLLYAGIVGNLIDRVFRGYVIDFLDFHWGASHFPCFNLADSFITVAAVLIVALSFAEEGAKKEKRNKSC
jgi:signal peptidase II